jgi:midasin (ATPase involved in ribosome maturation)
MRSEARFIELLIVIGVAAVIYLLLHVARKVKELKHYFRMLVRLGQHKLEYQTLLSAFLYRSTTLSLRFVVSRPLDPAVRSYVSQHFVKDIVVISQIPRLDTIMVKIDFSVQM